MTSAAQRAYEAYGDSREWKTFDGGAMPAWEAQSLPLKRAWAEAASAGETPVPARTAAWQHAVVTWLAGLAATVLTYVVPILLAASGNLKFTTEWWHALGVQVASAILAGVIAYVSRYARK